ncbi:sensor histidine kinase [Paracoccus aminophilus]|uniref:histidine kinase n=1 Tax=Paracoccus aminophilus JCM 7686 TaxID=1367847 RepID=S5XP93_PARAH|nr:ATP-binding protein [Paracoccus aminophilus]AGT09144.1 two-component system, OmpR family, phosphate regulon sensor histidine kinase PhoR [Paracoccus aminophilus JCM 7686]
MSGPDGDMLIEAVPAAMLVVDRQSRLVLANAEARALFGEAIVGRPFVTVLRHPGINEALERVLLGVSQQSLTATFTVQGRDLTVEVRVTPLSVAGGRGAALAFEDRSSLERAEQMRRDFVANVSHELRTPLTALMGFIETLRGPAKNDANARDRFLGIMEREAGRMNRLVGDLLSLSRVEAEERRRPVQSVELTGLLRNVIAALRPTADAAGVTIELAPPDEPVTVAGDADQLVQVFDNLIENAVKYGGRDASVHLGFAYLEHEPVLRGPAWAITVADQGEGIAPEHLPRLTERFYRVDTHRSREQGGTGLGLAIVKHIVNRHRGRLKIESEKGKGSRFIVILPDQIGKS